MTGIFLGLGSDTGNRIRYISEAERMIGATIGKIICSSSVYETEPWGFESERKFFNRVLEVETDLDPSGLLGSVLKIESDLGRIRSGKGYSSRTIDIDILFFGDEIINEGSLVIPHPLLHERRFVLVPLNEIAPGLVHPVFEKRISILLKECKDESEGLICNK
jgi:2-amino-4-hydroxy-6-hydroxymethyldihydropteridine diphosphokinase